MFEIVYNKNEYINIGKHTHRNTHKYTSSQVFAVLGRALIYTDRLTK